jgi:hypothetical protein
MNIKWLFSHNLNMEVVWHLDAQIGNLCVLSLISSPCHAAGSAPIPTFKGE